MNALGSTKVSRAASEAQSCFETSKLSMIFTALVMSTEPSSRRGV